MNIETFVRHEIMAIARPDLIGSVKAFSRFGSCGTRFVQR